MKCPDCKKATLTVARTYADNDMTVRDRKCPKCGTYHKTYEVHESYLRKLRQDLHDARDQRDIESYAIERELHELRNAARVFVEAAKKGKG